MTLPATTDAQRAVVHHAEELYEAQRGLVAAYAVDTGDHKGAAAPPWDDLKQHEQLAFLLAVAAVISPLTNLVNRFSKERRP